MLTPPARAVPLLPFKRAPASWAEQTNVPGVHTPAPGNKRRPSTDAVPRKNISLIPRNPCRKKRAELQSLRTENDALFQARILFEDKFTARRRCVPQEQAVPSPASSRKPPRRTWSGRMRPVPRLRTHMFREAVPVRHPHAVPRKDCSPLPEGGGDETSLPLCLPTEKRHALPMPLPSAVAKAPPSGRLASPARRASQEASPPAEPQLSAQNKHPALQLPLEPGAKKTPCCPLSEISLRKAGPFSVPEPVSRKSAALRAHPVLKNA